MKNSTLAAAVLAASLVGCAITQPVVVLSGEGTMRGTVTAAASGGSFTVSNARTTCVGSYDSMAMSDTISMVVQCRDGRRGIAVVTRTSGVGGHGNVRLNDGTTADLIFGPAAAGF